MPVSVTMNLSGKTFDVKDTIRAKGFKWNAPKKNWKKDCTNLTFGIDALESIKTELEAAGVRAVAIEPFNGGSRVVWWEDYGRVSAKMLANPNEGDEGDVRTVTNDVLRNGAITHEAINTAVQAQNAREAVCNLANQVRDARAGGNASQDEEIVIEIPLWLARQLGCSRVLRGHYEGTGEMREYTRRDGRTGRATTRHFAGRFVGRNEIGGTSRCYRCGRELTDPVSRAIGYGAECCRNIGVSRRVNMDDVNNIQVMDELIRNTVVDVWLPINVTRRRG